VDIFNSQWLIQMLAKSSKTPQGRILSLFDVLQDWLNAPNIHIEIEENATSQALIAFCTEQAKACGAANPSILAEHIVLIARNAAQQEVSHPNSGSFSHAKKAASALILAQTQSDHLLNKPTIYAIAASLFLIVGAAAIWLPIQDRDNLWSLAQNNVSKNGHVITAAYSPKQAAEVGITADEAAKMYSKYEQMRNGTCQFPEALQIPDKDKTVYIENVVNGNLPTNLNDLAIANSYLEKVRCNFTPMLMAKSK
jgi:hypothetical protein